MTDEARKNIEQSIQSGKVFTLNGADVKVIPLGTGSVMPTKYQNSLFILHESCPLCEIHMYSGFQNCPNVCIFFKDCHGGT